MCLLSSLAIFFIVCPIHVMKGFTHRQRFSLQLRFIKTRIGRTIKKWLAMKWGPSRVSLMWVACLFRASLSCLFVFSARREGLCLKFFFLVKANRFDMLRRKLTLGSEGWFPCTVEKKRFCRKFLPHRRVLALLLPTVPGWCGSSSQSL